MPSTGHGTPPWPVRAAGIAFTPRTRARPLTRPAVRNGTRCEEG
ncbi:hypothetical protein STVIR_4680 [Streptomyces viridochromogenes Tue57]|uniref:Uncharacterized protein n=1 Tax=Streptomyces viridochromogenes Tue57 TaxID=1160705 RepID=L8PD60_STRVR|nr:hypothetical protein STVIR_4680 [Streptomyces viridochromogenes Tue57]